MKRLLFIVALAFFASNATAEICTHPATTHDWSAITTISAGSFTGCTPDSTDTFIIPSGANVTVTGDIQQTGTAGGIQCQDGATLTIDVRNRTSNPGDRITIQRGGGTDLASVSDDYPSLGFHAAPTCDLRIRGGWRDFYNVTTVVDDPTFWALGTEIHFCQNDNPSADCDEVELEWSYSQFSNKTSVDFNNLAAIWDQFNDGDVLYFGDPDRSDKHASTDFGAMYDLVSGMDFSPVAQARIEFNVQQGTAAYTEYPLARREIKTVSLTAGARPGDRALTVAGSFIDDAPGTFTDVEHAEGLFVRCAGTAAPYTDIRFWSAFRVQRVIDGDAANPATDDTIILADSRGWDQTCASGDELWIEPGGWTAGDHIALMVPVRFTSATADDEDSNVLIESADMDISEALFTGQNEIRFSQEASASTRTISRLRYLWARDCPGLDIVQVANGRTRNACVNFDDLAAGDIGPGLISGGATHAAANSDAFHGIAWRGPGGGRVLKDWMVRHREDDSFLFRNAGGGDGATGTTETCGNIEACRPYDLRIENFRAQYKSDNAASMNGLQVSLGAVDDGRRVVLENIECIRATEGSACVDSLVNAGFSGATVVKNLVAIASDMGGLGEQMDITNFLSAGGRYQLTHENLNKFVIRGFTQAAGGSGTWADDEGCSDGAATAATCRMSIRNGYLRNFSFDGTQAGWRPDEHALGTMTNVAIIDGGLRIGLTGTTVGLIQANDTTGTLDFAFDQVTFLMTPGVRNAATDPLYETNQLHNYFKERVAYQTGSSNFTFRNTLMANLRGSNGGGWTHTAAPVAINGNAEFDFMTYEGNVCFWWNQQDINTGLTITSTTMAEEYRTGQPWGVRSFQRPDWVDTTGFRKDFGCGARSNAGISDMVPLAWSGLRPETLGRLGGGGSRRFPGGLSY